MKTVTAKFTIALLAFSIRVQGTQTCRSEVLR